VKDPTFDHLLTELTNMAWHAGKDDGRFNLDLDYCAKHKALLNHVARIEADNARLREEIAGRNEAHTMRAITDAQNS